MFVFLLFVFVRCQITKILGLEITFFYNSLDSYKEYLLVHEQ